MKEYTCPYCDKKTYTSSLSPFCSNCKVLLLHQKSLIIETENCTEKELSPQAVKLLNNDSSDYYLFIEQVKRIESLTGLKPNSKVCDIGSGAGFISYALAERGHSVTSIESKDSFI
jgi:2-polyprenyl-3-methyl-5-hydroxy-6-metoxy-1,4-benzoquinol methylase